MTVQQQGHRSEGCTFRHNLYAAYKSNRLITPDTVRHAVRDTKHALLEMGVKVIEVPGVEAADVIGTLSVQAVEAGMKVRIASLDKDFFQILSPQLWLLRFQQKGPGCEYCSFNYLSGSTLLWHVHELYRFLGVVLARNWLLQKCLGYLDCGLMSSAKVFSSEISL